MLKLFCKNICYLVSNDGLTKTIAAMDVKQSFDPHEAMRRTRGGGRPAAC